MSVPISNPDEPESLTNYVRHGSIDSAEGVRIGENQF